MTKKDIVEKLHIPGIDLSWGKKMKIVTKVFDIIKKELLAGGKVTIVGLGRFEVRHHSEKHGWNMKENKPYKIPPMKHLRFIEARTLKPLLNPKKDSKNGKRRK